MKTLHALGAFIAAIGVGTLVVSSAQGMVPLPTNGGDAESVSAHAEQMWDGPEDGPARALRIVGGKELTSLSQNPGAVGLQVKVDNPNIGGFVCGATRIAPGWALTAKHCIEDPNKYTFTAISSNTIRRSEGPRIPIEKVIVHPKAVDLAVLKLATADGPGKIATWSDALMKTGDPLTTYGWGNTKSSLSPSLLLKSATGTVKRHSKSPIGGLQEGTDIVWAPVEGMCWTGDSGGPLFNAQGQLIGVTSWSNGVFANKLGECGFVALHHEAAWLKEVTGIAPGTVFEAIPDPNPTPTGTEPAPGTTPFPTAPATPTKPAPTPTSTTRP